MSGGAAIEDSLFQAYQELKRRKVNRVFNRLSDDLSTVVPESEGTLTHEELLERLPADAPRFVACDFAFTNGGGNKLSKVVLVSWSPDGAPVKEKMVHTSSYTTLRDRLDSVGARVQPADVSEVGYDDLVSRAS